MSIYGLGAMYGSTDDMSDDFIALNVACVGWSEGQSPSCLAMLRDVRVGDIVFIKSFSPTGGLYIRAVGIVTDNDPEDVLDSSGNRLGYGVKTRWVWHTTRGQAMKIGKLEDKLDYMRRGTLYPEHSPTVQQQVITLLLEGRA